ncbi:FecR domain-containing protein [Flammeovirgaceae bacterium SG7u.111]|nr:FecR domain-containing protein [Flammeovirgaceae bacterium SG7u.132]WPO38099.1 FecR domain-containing protein [Flammeovirgaceae bacterium SG7u.111]
MNNWELLAKYISEECTIAEVVQVHEWLKENPEQEAFLDRARQTWHMSALDVEAFRPDLAAARVKVNMRISNNGSFTPSSTVTTSQPAQTTNHVFLFRRVAAAVLVGFFLSYLIYFFVADFAPTDRMLTKVTRAGEKAEVILADGTHVWLNEKASFKYPEEFNAKNREVFLEGEAYFDVERDEASPFFIYAGNTITQVLGTSFSVTSKKDGEVVVDVVEGSVLFYEEESEEKGVVLIEGEQAVLKPEVSQIVKSKSADPNRQTWHTGVLQFKNMPLAQVVDILTDFYGQEIEIGDDAIKNCHYNATFDNQTLEDVLEVMELSIAGLEVKKEEGKILLTGKGCF